jgi:hypothetical protein
MIPRTRHLLHHVRAIAAQIDYAERRLLELRTGIPLTPETERALARAEIARLEAAYAHSDSDREPGRDREREHSTPLPPARS